MVFLVCYFILFSKDGLWWQDMGNVNLRNPKLHFSFYSSFPSFGKVMAFKVTFLISSSRSVVWFNGLWHISEDGLIISVLWYEHPTFTLMGEIWFLSPWNWAGLRDSLWILFTKKNQQHIQYLRLRWISKTMWLLRLDQESLKTSIWVSWNISSSHVSY